MLLEYTRICRIDRIDRIEQNIQFLVNSLESVNSSKIYPNSCRIEPNIPNISNFREAIRLTNTRLTLIKYLQWLCLISFWKSSLSQRSYCTKTHRIPNFTD